MNLPAASIAILAILSLGTIGFGQPVKADDGLFIVNDTDHDARLHTSELDSCNSNNLLDFRPTSVNRHTTRSFDVSGHSGKSCENWIRVEMGRCESDADCCLNDDIFMTLVMSDGNPAHIQEFGAEIRNASPPLCPPLVGLRVEKVGDHRIRFSK